MARTENRIHEVDVGSAPIERFRPLVGTEVWPELEGGVAELRRRLDGHVLWNVNSTARGGGVAEMLASLIPYDRGAGIDERWAVIEGSPEFFSATKKIHTLLHGVQPDGGLTAGERRDYQEATARNSKALAHMISPGDVAILHDPQTAGLVPGLRARGIKVIWRSHIGVDEPNDFVRSAWDFLRPFVAEASACVFSRAAYAWDGLDESRVRIIAPCIDPFATKNQDMSDESGTAILQASGLLEGSDGDATFTRHDGSQARVTRSAQVGNAPVALDARIVLQVSRWDRLKDPVGVMDSFVRFIEPHTDACLVLAGPASTSVTDDPEQPEILEDLRRRHDAMSPAKRHRVVIAQIPMQDTEENAAIVNALQRRADVVVQKSLAEGFGLTVSEAMWKRRPVVASRVGGIPDQIEQGRSGVLVDDARDLRAFGDAVVGLLLDEPLGRRLGVEARHRVVRKFISPCHLIAQARLVVDLVA